jgi:hypothetical protein
MSAVGHFTLETYLEEVALVMRKFLATREQK